MSKVKKPMVGFVLSLLAGDLILINGALLGTDVGNMIILYSGAMGVNPFVTQIPLSLLYIFMAIGLIFGLIVDLGALMVYRNPHQKVWGVIILIFSIISIIIGGGFLFGMILGIIGGARALSWKPKATI